jgi:NAD(P)-binding Rossmann-like domain
MLGQETSGVAAKPSAKRVAVIGGGVAGLSAAHELAKQGLSVTVFERRPHVGGKASSSEWYDLPAEHGFRFFPGFYWHVVKAMSEIPAAGGQGYVADHLVELDASVFTDQNGQRLTVPLPTRSARPSMRERLAGMSTFRKSMPGPWECACFLGLVARLATTCETRWNDQLENESWFDHVMPTHRTHQWSPQFRRLFAIGLTRSFVATRAEEMNARTGGKILLQLLYDTWFGPPYRRAADRALDGPTTKVWIDPWKEFLENEWHVEFVRNTAVVGLDVSGDQISGVQLRQLQDNGEPVSPDADPTRRSDFDCYLLAVPCEVLKQILVRSDGLLDLDGSLATIFELKTRWMNGIVIGLPAELDPPLPKGHILCLSSEWALTLVDQSKFWSDEHLKNIRARWKTLLSVDISDWEKPGRNGLPAKWPPTPDLLEDLWSQLKDHLPELHGHDPAHYNLDFDIRYNPSEPPAAGRVEIAHKRTNDEPLLINTPESWDKRPTGKTSIANLFIAGDFAQTYTNFASMEAANEAARRAANALVGRDEEYGLEPLQDPQLPWFSVPQDMARRIDRVIYASWLPLRPPFRLTIAAWIVLALTEKLKSIGRSDG